MLTARLWHRPCGDDDGGDVVTLLEERPEIIISGETACGGFTLSFGAQL